MKTMVVRFLLLLTLCGIAAAQTRVIDSVDPRIGVLGAGGNVIGPSLPWGSIHPSPDGPGGKTAGYKDGKIRGFSQAHVSGTGGHGKYGTFLISPQIGMAFGEEQHDSEISDERAAPGYYAVTLARYNIRAEVAPAAHAAIYRFTFPASNDAALLFDLSHTIPGDIIQAGGGITAGKISVNNAEHTIDGWGEYLGGWAGEPFRIYFHAVVDHAGKTGVWKQGEASEASEATVEKPGDRVSAYLHLNTKGNEAVLVKIGISFTSSEQAAKYIAAEIPGWSFDRTRKAAEEVWSRRLGSIQVEGGTPAQRKIFYTSLYHSFIMPRDRTADNPRYGQEPLWDDQYATWDTWRTLYPLMSLIAPEMVVGNVRSMINRWQRNGRVMDAFAAGNERDYDLNGDKKFYQGNQGGDDATNVIADAYARKLPGIDWEAAYAVMKGMAEKQREPAYLENDRGWIPQDLAKRHSWVSTTMEAAYNDYCTSAVARGLGKRSDADRFLKRSEQWVNVWDPDLESEGFKGFVCPRKSDGTWVARDPAQWKDQWSGPYYEGTGWIYSFFAPHDFARLIAMCGGRKAFVERLERGLQKGLIDFSNEPSFMTLRSFHYAGRPDRTSYWTREVMKQYTEQGYPGDEDSGAMGSWYALSAIGLFPNAGQDVWLINAPLFPKTVVHLGNGATLTIVADGLSETKLNVQSATLNGKPLTRAWLHDAEIRKGGELRLVMAHDPSDWGTKELPPSASGPGR